MRHALAAFVCLTCMGASTTGVRASEDPAFNPAIIWIYESQGALAVGSLTTMIGNAVEPGSKAWVVTGYATGGLSLALGLPVVFVNDARAHPYYVMGVANVLMGLASLAVTIYSHAELDRASRGADRGVQYSLGPTVLRAPATGEQSPGMLFSGRF